MELKLQNLLLWKVIKDLPIAEDIEIVKVTPSKDNQVEGVSGASVSSKAVATAVNDAIRFL